MLIPDGDVGQQLGNQLSIQLYFTLGPQSSSGHANQVVIRTLKESCGLILFLFFIFGFFLLILFHLF